MFELVDKFTLHRSEHFFNFSKCLTIIHFLHFKNVSIFNIKYIKKYLKYMLRPIQSRLVDQFKHHYSFLIEQLEIPLFLSVDKIVLMKN